MNRRQFYTSLGGTMGICGFLLVIIHSFDLFRSHWLLSLCSVALFVVLSVLNFNLGAIAVRSDNKYLYNNIIIGNFVSKLLFSLILVAVYVKFWSPEDSYFVLPFIVVYIIFTIFETAFMMKQSNVNPKV